VTRIAGTAAVLAAAMVLVLGTAAPASAQDDDVIGAVDISFDVGDLDPIEGDWTIDAVEVSGELEEGRDFTLELTDEDGGVIWSSTQPFTAPVTRVTVTDVITVSEVAAAGVAQGITVVGGVQIEPPEVDWQGGPGGGGGQLALSMVMAVLLVAIVFRTPLPSASTQRWTK
jgi:hypothetical protein